MNQKDKSFPQWNFEFAGGLHWNLDESFQEFVEGALIVMMNEQDYQKSPSSNSKEVNLFKDEVARSIELFFLNDRNLDIFIRFYRMEEAESEKKFLFLFDKIKRWERKNRQEPKPHLPKLIERYRKQALQKALRMEKYTKLREYLQSFRNSRSRNFIAFDD